MRGVSPLLPCASSVPLPCRPIAHHDDPFGSASLPRSGPGAPTLPPPVGNKRLRGQPARDPRCHSLRQPCGPRTMDHAAHSTSHYPLRTGTACWLEISCRCPYLRNELGNSPTGVVHFKAIGAFEPPPSISSSQGRLRPRSPATATICRRDPSRKMEASSR